MYTLGFVIGLIGLMAAINHSTDLEIYYLLIPFLLVLGLVFAALYLILKNVTLAKLSRTLPRILLVALILLYVFSVFQSANDLMGIEGPGDEPQHPGDYATPAENQTYQQEMDVWEQERQAAEQEMETAFNNLNTTIVNPGFFLLLTAIVIVTAGGTMLWTSTKIQEQFVPATIILEVPARELPPPEEIEDYNGEIYEETEETITEEPIAPEPGPCANCGESLTFIEQYDRWYCYACKEYAPKE